MTRARGPVGEDAPLRRAGITRGLMNNGHRSIDRYQFDFDRSWIRNKRNFVSSTVFSLSYLFFLWFLHRRSASLVKAEKKKKEETSTDFSRYPLSWPRVKNRRLKSVDSRGIFQREKMPDSAISHGQAVFSPQNSLTLCFAINGAGWRMASIPRWSRGSFFFPLADNWGIGMVNLSYWSNWNFHTDIILQHVELYTMANKL